MNQNKLPIFFTVILSVLFASCEKETVHENTISNTQHEVSTETLEDLTRANNDFAIKLFKEIHKSQADSNMVISPYSVSMALAMTYNGARSNTKSDMASTLEWSMLKSDEVNAGFKQQMARLSSLDQNVPLNIANSIWYKHKYPFNQSFLGTNKTYFDAQIVPADFSLEQTKDRINNWADENTNHKIPEVLDRIDPETVMFLLNAIYFKGNWKVEFDPANTVSGAFLLPSGTSVVSDEMVIHENFNYTENDLLQLVELPYGDGKFSMLILVPKYGKTSSDIVDQLNRVDLETWISNMKETEVQLHMPRFKTEYEIKLNSQLINLGMGSAFSGLADFTGISEDGGLSLSMVKQNAFIEVNEEGTEAAAVTVVGVYTTSMPPFPMIMANKPFIYIIRDVENNNLLFMGQLANPAK